MRPPSRKPASRTPCWPDRIITDAGSPHALRESPARSGALPSRARAAARSARRCSARRSRRTRSRSPPRCSAIAACDVRLADLTATGQTVDRPDRAARRRRVPSHADRLPEHDADARRRRRGHGGAQGALRRAAVLLRAARLVHAGRRRWRAPRPWTACSSASRRTGCWRSAQLDSLDRLERDSEPDVPARRADRAAPRRRAGSRASSSAPFPAWELLDLDQYRLPLVNERYVIVETSRGCPVLVRLLRRADSSGPQVPREERAHARRRDGARRTAQFGLTFFYLWGDTVTLNVKTFSAFCEELIARKLPVQWFGNARADNLGDPAFVKRLREAGLLDARARHRDRVGRDAQGHDEAARRPEDPRGARQHARGRHPLVRLLHPRLPGRDAADISIARSSTRSSSIPTSPISIRPCRTRAPSSTPRPSATACSSSEDWSTMEYSYYLLRGNGLDEPTVMNAINRAKRRFYLRPAYLVRHAGDVVRLMSTQVERGLARRVPVHLRRAGHRRGTGRPRPTLSAPPEPARSTSSSVSDRYSRRGRVPPDQRSRYRSRSWTR